MTSNYQTSTIHSTIKFENCLPSGLAKVHQKYSKTIDFFRFIFATVNNY